MQVVKNFMQAVKNFMQAVKTLCKRSKTLYLWPKLRTSVTGREKFMQAVLKSKFMARFWLRLFALVLVTLALSHYFNHVISFTVPSYSFDHCGCSYYQFLSVSPISC